MIKDNPYRQSASGSFSNDDSIWICAAPRTKERSKNESSVSSKVRRPQNVLPKNDVTNPQIVDETIELESDTPDPMAMFILPRHDFDSHDSKTDVRLICIGVLAAAIGLAVFLL